MLNIRSQIGNANNYGKRAYKIGEKYNAETERLVLSLSGYVSVRSDKFDTLEEAYADLKLKIEALKQREEYLINNPLELMADLCKKHDFTYMYSDDGSKHDAGHRTHQMMRQIVAEYGEPARAIWYEHAPGKQFII